MKAVILAGGQGKRLRPFTSVLPKPLIPIDDRPILDILLNQLANHGVTEVVIALNYLGSLIQSYLEASEVGKRLKIRYHWESQPLGTAGAIGTVEDIADAPFLVMNGDLLTAVNFNKMIAYHRASESLATMCVRDYRVPIPFGVVELDGNRVSAIVEKPVKTYFVNAGIYVLEPEILSRVPRGQYLDMTTLLDRIMAEGGSVSSFPIHEYWLDIGRFDDLQQAQNEFDRVFGS